MAQNKKILVVQVAALGWDFVRCNADAARTFDFHSAETVFPAVTCPVQASFRTASRPRDHGIVSNGVFFGDVKRIAFWEQSAALVAGPRIWQQARAAGKRVGMMFWQQSLGEGVDLLLSPKPVHKHHGGMLQDCYTQPPDLYDRLQASVGRPFNLMHYWGPLASRRSSDWIVAATNAVMSNPSIAPDLLISYMPHLDYDLQRHGPESRKAQTALAVAMDHLEQLRTTAERSGYDYFFYGDYNIEPVTGEPVFPNRVLREAGLFKVRHVKGMAYPDFFASTGFSLVDHQVAHVFLSEESALQEARRVFTGLPGIADVLDWRAQTAAGLDTTRSGELVLVAEKGSWFAYPWWEQAAESPDYAGHVDIHNKPGYDPCELFFGWPPPNVSRDPTRIRGTHGRVGEGCEIAWTSSLEFDEQPRGIVKLAQQLKRKL